MKKTQPLSLDPIVLSSIRKDLLNQAAYIHSSGANISKQKVDADLIIKEAKKLEDYVLGKK